MMLDLVHQKSLYFQILLKAPFGANRNSYYRYRISCLFTGVGHVTPTLVCSLHKIVDGSEVIGQLGQFLEKRGDQLSHLYVATNAVQFFTYPTNSRHRKPFKND